MADARNTAKSDKLIVTGLFKDKESAECAYSAVSTRGYERDDVDVVMSNETRDRYYPGGSYSDKEAGTKALEGTGTGAAIGGTVGAVLAAIAAVGTSIALPGLGLVIAGPLAAALVGAGAGGLAGGLVGALIGYGIPEEHAKAYESGVKEGGIVLRAAPRNADDANYFENKWKECGGERIYSSARQQAAATATANMRDRNARDMSGKEVVIPVVEEELQVGKRTVERGGVRVETNVEEKPVEETVTLREERVNVERRPADRPLSEADVRNLKEGVVEVAAKAEEPVVNKQARVVEEVVVGKDVTERTETVRDTVRRTDVDVEKMPNARGKSTTR